MEPLSRSRSLLTNSDSGLIPPTSQLLPQHLLMPLNKSGLLRKHSQGIQLRILELKMH
ncbi:UNVERIFIED_CONTAM: hypothetical protein GTU68_044683 [Idotea baltica]|nr:hypothetical protein [Idotea baltica]